ncbi:ShlB/FhaC/HecB family hemolysin secretion/activation protein [Rhizobium sp. BK650]|uniref:ShlB/FhaC/HecB family hemolysin secretion/activation protein n=1 Tax=Rhizobium sp. BK650 TaxID=2586990 RepID=UPI00162087D0|nr:ShlB/FhaC/HecB family hemolysin secretion/activation protein [Rhizobium sp. BK650]
MGIPEVFGDAKRDNPFELAGQHLQLATIINGQYSPDNLFRADEISMGGYGNMRGTRESVLFGNDGVFARNELVRRTQPWAGNALLARRLGELRSYAGIDFGHVFGQARLGCGGLTLWNGDSSISRASTGRSDLVTGRRRDRQLRAVSAAHFRRRGRITIVSLVQEC